ncbi:hypothetical protein LEP1GSC008_0254 [Leptospira kirschneri serovar Bulgarica str. Nikolaevo]|uniref:Uncharacterized protein n=1 Tax=Leptospira kirschneri serovar Bulgarica str. Nikolaevo TaxID=1240687 RepID=M6FDG2_9LEPT|nr:hypothetical protein LEP1GSC008_0254 [Leptospira kirschneri serovar Bulgarica str. Nikolaevo]
MKHDLLGFSKETLAGSFSSLNGEWIETRSISHQFRVCSVLSLL